QYVVRQPWAGSGNNVLSMTGPQREVGGIRGMPQTVSDVADRLEHRRAIDVPRLCVAGQGGWVLAAARDDLVDRGGVMARNVLAQILDDDVHERHAVERADAGPGSRRIDAE